MAAPKSGNPQLQHRRYMPKRAHNQFIERNFSSIWPVHLSGFTRLLTQLRLHFDNDLDLLLIMAAIGERTRPESWKDELQSLSVLTDPSESEHLQDPINTQSVSEFTGIPRETVRRKLMILQEKGWVLRDSDGRLSVSSVAGPNSRMRREKQCPTCLPF